MNLQRFFLAALVVFTISLLSTGVATAMDGQGSQEGLNKSLFKALERNNKEEIEQVLARATDINAVLNNALNRWGETPLMVAVQKNSPEIVKLLLEKGADLNIKTIKSSVRFKYTALHYAALRGDLEIVNVLLASGADPNARARVGDIPLRMVNTGREGALELIKLLLVSGANPDICKGGESALYYAVYNNREDEVETLLEHGANPNIKQESLLLFLDDGYNHLVRLAYSKGNQNIIEMLLSYGADPHYEVSGPNEVSGPSGLIFIEESTMPPGMAHPQINKETNRKTKIDFNKKETNLTLAVGQGSYDEVISILKSCVIEENEMLRALHRAAITGRTNIFRELFFLKLTSTHLQHTPMSKVVEQTFLAAVARGQWAIIEFLRKTATFELNLTDEALYRALLQASVKGYVQIVRLILGLNFERNVSLDLSLSAQRINQILQESDLAPEEREAYGAIRSLLVGYQHTRRLERILRGSQHNFSIGELSTSIRNLPEEIRHHIARFTIEGYTEEAATDYRFMRSVLAGEAIKLESHTDKEINFASQEALMRSLSRAVAYGQVSNVRHILGRDFERSPKISQADLNALIIHAIKVQAAARNNKAELEEIMEILSGHTNLREKAEKLNQNGNFYNVRLPPELQQRINRFVLGGFF